MCCQNKNHTIMGSRKNAFVESKEPWPYQPDYFNCKKKRVKVE
jgi:hypothetical protein